jgi:hypothetical protein
MIFLFKRVINGNTMKQITKKEFKKLDISKVKYLLWKQDSREDFSIIVDYNEDNFTIHDYCMINSDMPSNRIIVTFEYDEIDFDRWDLFILTEKEGRMYYKKLLAYNIFKKHRT